MGSATGHLGAQGREQKRLDTGGAGDDCDCDHDANMENTTPSYINVNDIRDFLNNKVYNQACFQFKSIVQLDDMYINFDLNRDGKIEIPPSGYNGYNSEMEMINQKGDDASCDYIIFIIDYDRTDQGCVGWGPRNLKYAYVFKDTSGMVK